ncbi:uroporphyrin-3 C-methyltransferase [Marinobacter daqiaonensis]|uniref:Uroporphyrin-3 C-methyltransferase n=1 Tax=Marinobacter daqiaonensis TaxID=650891 RepID=A0A1I6JTY5_9GAMM|nr:uroporphyrin-3 C-methyltransferase [Marinobacter daqiaonensis]
MTESNNQSQLPATVPNHSSDAPQARLWPLWILGILLLVGLIALAGWNWQQRQAQQNLQQTIDHVSEINNQLDNRLKEVNQGRSGHIDSLQTSQRDLRQGLEELQQRLNQQQRQLDHVAEELLEAGNRTRTDWLLAEAEYLLRIANQRLQIENDIRGGLAALREADEVLRETDDIGTYPVREQLARDIMALRSVSNVDRTGLYLKLEAAREAVSQLTDRALIEERAPGFSGMRSEGEGATGEDAGPFTKAWRQVRSSLANVVSIRRLDQPVEPLLSPEQSAWARLNLQLMLEQAELAVLQGHPELYQRSLDKAIDALNRWYHDDQRVEALRETVAELRQRDIDPELPDISRSLTLLKGRIAGRHTNTEARMNGESQDQGDGEAGGDDS